MLMKKLCLGIIALVLGGAMTVSPVFAAEEHDGLTNEDVTVPQEISVPEEPSVFGYYNSIATRELDFVSMGVTYHLTVKLNCDTDSSTGYIRSVSLNSNSSNLPSPYYSQVIITSTQRTGSNSFYVLFDIVTRKYGIEIARTIGHVNI